MGRNHTFIDSEFGTHNFNHLDQGSYEKGLVGISMPFRGEMSDEIYTAIKEECLKLGLIPRRVDEYTKSGVVLYDIAELIEKAEFLIFDLTYERQNVYYELGYAHGVGNEASEILLIAAEGTKLHYDVAGLRVHFFSTIEDLKKVISKALIEMRDY
jgi:hypothetical protein